jgi:hypothetical protein
MRRLLMMARPDGIISTSKPTDFCCSLLAQTAYTWTLSRLIARRWSVSARIWSASRITCGWTSTGLGVGIAVAQGMAPLHCDTCRWGVLSYLFVAQIEVDGSTSADFHGAGGLSFRALDARHKVESADWF